MTTALNRTVQLLLTNKSGGSVAQGDVVVIDTTTASSFTTTTTSAYVAEAIGVVLEPNGIANNASGMVAINGYVPKINLSGSASLGDFVKTHTVAGQGVRHATPSVAGDFAQVLATGTSPAAFLFGFTNQGGSGTPLTVKEIDGAPSVANVNTIEVTNGTLTDNGGGDVTITIAGGAPTTAEYVTTASDGTLSAEVNIPGLAGSADISGAGGAGTSEEYDTSTTGLSWSPSSPATVDSDTTVKSHLYMKATDSVERFGTKAWSPAGAFDARAKIELGTTGSGQQGSLGLLINDSGNNNRLMVTLGWSAVGGNANVSAFTYASATYTQRGSNIAVGSNMQYLRITRDGSNNVSFWCSSDGHVWGFIATLSFTLTVANIGYRAGSASPFESVVDWLRTDV